MLYFDIVILQGFNMNGTNPFLFFFFEKCQDGNYLKFGEAFYFFIHTSFGPKTLFNQIHTLSSKFGNLIHNFNRNEKVLARKYHFHLPKSKHLF